MTTRRTFFTFLLGLFGLSKAATAEPSPSGPIRQEGWVAMPEKEFERLKSAANPILSRSEYVPGLYACWPTPGWQARMFEKDDAGLTDSAKARRSAVFAHCHRILEKARSLGIDPEQPGWRIEIRLVEDRDLSTWEHTNDSARMHG